MDKHRPLITPGCTVLLAGFDDIPEHAFLVEEVFEDLITGHCPHRTSLWGIRRTRHHVGSAGAHSTNLATEQSKAGQSRARQGRA